MLYRKVSCARWKEPRLREDGFKAELLRDLAVDSDGLSVWTGPAEAAARAMAASKDRKKIEPICLLAISEELLADLEIDVANNPGRTEDQALAGSHRTIECVSGEELMQLVDELSQNPRTKQFSKSAVGQLLGNSIEQGLDIGALHPRLLDDLMGMQVVSESDGHGVLEAHFKRDPCALGFFKAERVVPLVQAGVITEERAIEHHPGYPTAIQKYIRSTAR